MENFVGLLYNSGATQEGLGYKNGFGSAYFISGASYNGGAYDKGMISLSGFDEKIMETEGFIFWAKFQILKVNTGVTSQVINGNNGYLFTTDSTIANPLPTTSAFTIGFEANVNPSISNGAPYLSLLLGKNLNGVLIPYRNSGTQTFSSISLNLLIYKDQLKNFNQASAFTSYANGYKNIYNAITYGLNHFLIKNIKLLYRGGFNTNTLSLGHDILLYNFGLAKTSMTPAQFDLFANKMNKYDNYWHLFEGETDTPNINQSDILFYAPTYQKFGGNSTSSRINFMYPKSTTKYGVSSSDNTSILNMILGNKNRWRKPYPPYEPYI